jgi:hypothetical protein
MKVNKNIKIFVNYFLGPVLFIWISWSIYNQLRQQPGIGESWQQIKDALASTKVVYLVVAVLLMFVNWGLEAYKWMIAVRQIQPVNFITAFKAVLSGISFSLTTPNRMGEYLGRVLYMDDGYRIKGISLTILSSISQLAITVLMGLIGLFFLGTDIITSQVLSPLWVKLIWYGTSIGFIVLALFYFRLPWFVKIIDKLPSSNRFSWMIEAVENINTELLIKFLLISLGRFIIFTLQYYLLFILFDVNVSIGQAWVGLSVMYLVMSVIPTIALFTDMSVRNEVSLKLMGLYSSNHLGISLTSLSVWFINLVIPAIIGSLLILGIKKIFKNKNEII